MLVGLRGGRAARMDVAGACGLAESMARELRRSLRGKARQAVALALRGRGRARFILRSASALFLRGGREQKTDGLKRVGFGF